MSRRGLHLTSFEILAFGLGIAAFAGITTWIVTYATLAARPACVPSSDVLLPAREPTPLIASTDHTTETLH